MHNFDVAEDYKNRLSILVVDDDDRIRDLVSRYLNDHGFLAFTAANAQDAMDILDLAEFDALVVDVMMPGKTGLEFTQELRETSQVPIILLTALGETEDRIAGLSHGADDYLPKPFDPRELVLRLQSILKRAPKTKSEQKIKIGDWEFDPAFSELVDGDERIKLTDVEVNLLKALATKPGEIFSREDLSAMCGLDAGERTIDVQVTRLRKKIEKDSKVPRYLQTVRGKGYLLYAQEI